MEVSEISVSTSDSSDRRKVRFSRGGKEKQQAKVQFGEEAVQSEGRQVFAV